MPSSSPEDPSFSLAGNLALDAFQMLPVQWVEIKDNVKGAQMNQAAGPRTREVRKFLAVTQ